MSSVVRFGSMTGGPWCSKWSRWMGDGDDWYWNSSSMSSVDSTLFLFLRWITSFLLKLLSNYRTVEVCSRMGRISAGWGSLTTVTITCSSVEHLVLWAPFFSRLLVRGWVGGGRVCGFSFTFFTWGVVVSSEGGATFFFVNTNPSSSSFVSAP